MTQYIEITRGQTLRIQLKFWQDTEKTAAVDLTNATVSIVDANKKWIETINPTIINASQGTIQIDFGNTRRFTSGLENYFKVKAQISNDVVLTPQIWIKAND